MNLAAIIPDLYTAVLFIIVIGAVLGLAYALTWFGFWLLERRTRQQKGGGR